MPSVYPEEASYNFLGGGRVYPPPPFFKHVHNIHIFPHVSLPPGTFPAAYPPPPRNFFLSTTLTIHYIIIPLSAYFAVIIQENKRGR